MVEAADLAIRLTGSEIRQVVFEGDSLLVLRPEDAAGLLKAARLFQNRPNPFTSVRLGDPSRVTTWVREATALGTRARVREDCTRENSHTLRM